MTDLLKELLGLPIIQVLVGAAISALVSWQTTRQTIRQQSLGLQVDAYSKSLERIRDVLAQLEPIEFSIVKGKIGQKVTAVQHYETVRKLFFKHASLIPPAVRSALYGNYQIAEAAYFYLHAPGEKHSELRGAVAEYSKQNGTDVDFLDASDTEALHRVITLFATEFRDALTNVSDVLTASVLLEY